MPRRAVVPRFPPRAGCSLADAGLQRRAAPVLVALAAALSGCASMPSLTLPPLVPSRVGTAPVPAASASTPIAAPAAMEPSPTTPSAVAAGTVPSPLETPAVAARFPDPSGAAPGGQITAPTGSDELRARLRNLTPSDSLTTLSVLPIGTSQDGAPIEAVLFTRQASPSPAVLVRSGRPTVLLVGQQQGDEPAGAEALLEVAQSLATGTLQPLLDRINVVILPRANPDGVLRAQAATLNGLDLDTDHLLLRTPEASAIARLLREYQPAVVAEAREYPVDATFPAQFGGAQRADVQLQYAGAAGVPEFTTKAAEEWFRQPLLTALQQDDLRTEWSHRVDPATPQRLRMGDAHPGRLRNAAGLRNAMAFTLESRGSNLGNTHLRRRVFSLVSATSSLLRTSAQRADDLVKLRRYVDSAVRADLCAGEVRIDPALTATEHSLVLLDAQTGADKTVAVAWDSAVSLSGGKRRNRPCGYWLGADQTDAAARLRALGLRVDTLSQSQELKRDLNAGEPVPGEREFMVFDAPAKSFYVPLSQPAGNLAVAALEPEAANGYVMQRVVTSPARVVKVARR